MGPGAHRRAGRAGRAPRPRPDRAGCLGGRRDRPRPGRRGIRGVGWREGGAAVAAVGSRA
ncbi:MAG TPA: hypothetical protein VKY74_08450 [Chloroflexia bacterium]|nr:hypothetical protein [Chloroflexia bacterium]